MNRNNLNHKAMTNIDLTATEENLYLKIKSKLIGYFKLGVTENKKDFQNSRSLILNALCISSIALVFGAFLLAGIYIGFLKSSWLLLTTPHLFYVLYLNSKLKFRKAKVIFLTFSIVIIGIISFFISGAGVEYNLIIAIILAPLLFVKLRHVLAYVFASLIVFFGVRYLALVFPLDHLTSVNDSLTIGINIGFAALFTLLLIIVSQRLNIKFSNSLILNNEYVNEKLLKSKQNYHSLFENMIEGFAYCKIVFENNKVSDFIYKDVNPSFENQTKLSNVIGKKISEVVPGIKESNSKLFKIIERVVLSGIPERFETYMPGLDSWFDITIYSIQTEHFVAVFDLISERKLAEDKQKLFTSIINTSDDAIISRRLDGIITSWNPGAEKSFGYSADEIIGKNISVIIPIHLRDKENEISEKEKIVERFETERIGKDGKIISVSLTTSPISNEWHDIVGFSTISRDISQRIKSEKSLKESLSFNKGILASLSSHIAVMNGDGVIIEVNKAWNDFARENGETRLSRVSIGRNYLDVCKEAIASGDAIAKDALKGILSVINNRELTFDMEYPCDSPGEIRWFSMEVTAFESDEQKIVVAHEDITDRKHAESALVDLNEHLEQKVEERTNSLTSSKNELEQKNRDITASITYALRLQKAILPDSKVLFSYFPDSFIINLPQSIVSGDFYWFKKLNNRFLISCADSTGHGVPGAFMSIVGAQLLNRAVEQDWKVPSNILELIDEGLKETLGRNDEVNIADGMDIAFCIIDPLKKKIDFAGAMSSIILDSSGKSQVYQGSRFALGQYIQMEHKHFETQVIKYNSGDMLYLYSDGLKDQFGGEYDKKFRFDRQVKLFEKIYQLPAHEQKIAIIETFEEWKGDLDQVDDVMVIGVRL